MKMAKKRYVILLSIILLPALFLTAFYAFPKNPWLNKSNILFTKFAGRVYSFWYGLSNIVTFTTIQP